MGGGGGSAAAPAPVAAAAPPPTDTSTEIVQAKRDARRQAQKKRGMQATILAGETGGYQPNENNVGKTLLGE